MHGQNHIKFGRSIPICCLLFSVVLTVDDEFSIQEFYIIPMKITAM